MEQIMAIFHFPRPAITASLRMLVLTTLIAILSPGVIYAADKPAHRNDMAELCFDCHGADNSTSDPLVPKLNGQLRSFLVKQTKYYISGERSDTVMSTVIGKFNLTEKNIAEIADFFSRLPPMKGTGKMTELGKKGRTIFIGQKCIFCHEEADKSVASYIGETVVIGGQNKSYLIKSMLDIRNRARIADGFDLMSKTVKHLSEDDIEAVAEYLSSI
jgi:cytochrome c553